jgi:hypothetical protein
MALYTAVLAICPLMVAGFHLRAAKVAFHLLDQQGLDFVDEIAALVVEHVGIVISLEFAVLGVAKRRHPRWKACAPGVMPSFPKESS